MNVVGIYAHGQYYISPLRYYNCIILSESAKPKLNQLTLDFQVSPLKDMRLACLQCHELVLCISRDYTGSNTMTCIHLTYRKYHYHCSGENP